ncbi:NAD-dependent protein deacetylase sirtuin-1-like [Tachypleus tridentatus]|uniref:NAD-dependent protein deacetylase sirtuin-1-like n=1 Tax=Tachypleus tridentatus TaxID=6853 RepID=UPI003FD22590
MDDGCTNLFDFPAHKKPRLGDGKNITTSCDVEERSLLSYEQTTSTVGLASTSAHNVGSSKDIQVVLYGNDSGFHDLATPTSAEDQEHVLNEENLAHFNASSLQADTSVHYEHPSELEERVKCHEDDEDEISSTVSNLSDISDTSDLSSQGWKPTSGPVTWVQQQIIQGIDPRTILEELFPQTSFISSHLDPLTLWKIIVSVLNEPPRRTKLPHINTLDDVVNLIQTSQNIMILTGAGVSVSCGIPDFRSRNGIYARLSKDFPELPDPQAMFDIHYFRKDPRPFFKFAKEIYPGQFKPSASHKFIRLIEDHGKLLRNYTQNIDTLEHTAGIRKAVTCHGSFATATCTKCGYNVDSTFIKEDIFNQRIPRCPKCLKVGDGLAIMKPDIVFFGEGLSNEFHQMMAKDKDQCDLLIVMGSSLKVRPVALIPSSIPPEVPQILINRERLKHLTFDVELLGDCDVIIQELCQRLGESWCEVEQESSTLQQISECLPNPLTSLTPVCTKSVPLTSFSQCRKNTSTSLIRENFEVSSRWLGSCQLCSTRPLVEEESTCSECSELSDIHLEDPPENTSTIIETSHKPKNINQESKTLQDYKQPEPNKPTLLIPPKNSFLFISPNRYIFHGAEEYPGNSGDLNNCHDKEHTPNSLHSHPPTKAMDNQECKVISET